MLLSYLGEIDDCPLRLDARSEDIWEATPRSLPPLVASKKLRFGTVGYGLDLARLVWSSEQQVFSCQDHDLNLALPHRPRAPETRGSDQLPKNFLKKNPLDALLVDEGLGAERVEVLAWIETCPEEKRPQVIAYGGPTEWIVESRHLDWRKRRRKAMERLGYTHQEWYMNSAQFGGALDQERIIDIYSVQGRMGPTKPEPQHLPYREMSNLLLPCGIPRRDWLPQNVTVKDQDEWEGPCHLTGKLRGVGIYCPDGCMPSRRGAWIKSDRGIRRLQAEEFSKGLGLPSEWRDKSEPLSWKAIGGTTSLHVWTAVGDALSWWLKGPGESREWDREARKLPSPVQEPLEEIPEIVTPEWNYEMPDLSKGGEWYQARVAKLKEVIKGRPDEEELLRDGLEALEIHRGNYTEAGPKYLQVLWWEFPETHREAVRIGSSMRFLVDPGDEIVPNPPMTPEQIEVVVEFIEELRDLGVVRPATRKLRRVCPIFVVPKPGQPGQWRCIADMRRGGQNECCSLDPIYLPTSRDILPYLYEGGWSGVADASKYFHNYPTLENERDLMGIIHPTTGEHLWYVGLPMGSVDSPSISCRFGEGILGQLREETPVFRPVKVIENSWRKALAEGTFHAEWGHGMVGFQVNGRPVALIRAFVDDFFIHAQTWEDCVEAMSAFMDMMIRLGLICQKVKTSPPCQVQKYCGFIYDCRGTPCLRIPEGKISRCIASIDFLLARPRDNNLSRLSLAVVTGVLQSVVEATPQKIGQGYLRRLYDDLHVLEEALETGHPQAKYYTTVNLSDGSLEGLRWWKAFLERREGAITSRRSSERGIFMKWGDGSGTGTGGTTEHYPVTEAQELAPEIELWMGVWKIGAKPNSSNWKELRTILESLRQERTKNRVRGCTVFYMTDNLVSYYVIRNGGSRIASLHSLVMELKELERELGCRLEVVHVPGTLMITQGTDGLSRGLWFAPERRSPGVNQLLFEGVPLTRELALWAMEMVGAWGEFEIEQYLAPPRSTLDGKGWHIWAPPPECARQVIVDFMQRWVQAPEETGAIFLVPRILQGSWGRICRYVTEIGVYQGGHLPDSCRFSAPIPFVLLCVFPHVHSLRRYRDRVEPFGDLQRIKWHQEQAEAVRGLS